MTNATCRPASTITPVAEREERPDRLVELLECLADLVVAIPAQRKAISELADLNDPRVRQAVERLIVLERELRGLSVEAATVHQFLQHEHLI